jgi:putative tributyrin esterase
MRRAISGPALALCATLLLAGCTPSQKRTQLDRPRLTPNVRLQDVIFHSPALNRDMPYRVILPIRLAAGQKLPVVYLLHGRGEDFRSWSNDSDVARFAERGLILVMPEGRSSYYTNSAKHPQDRYEDYLANDLISDVESRFPIATGRANRAVVGVSMGGFGAVKLAFDHPELFAFAGAMSPAIDVPSRSFSLRRLRQSFFFDSIFGPGGSESRRRSDPFVLARTADPAKIPYLFLTCGKQESLLAPNHRFAALLAQRHFRYEFHTVPGGHDWNQWNGWLPDLFQSLLEHFATTSEPLAVHS